MKNIAESVQAYRVLLGKGDAELWAARPAVATQPQHPKTASAAAGANAARRPARRSRRERLKRRGGIAAALIAFLFAINMFSWSGELWFQFPAAAILLLFALRTFWIGWKDEA